MQKLKKIINKQFKAAALKGYNRFSSLMDIVVENINFQFLIGNHLNCFCFYVNKKKD